METGNEKCVASRPCQDGNPDVQGDNDRPPTIRSLALSAALPNLPDISAAQRRSLSRDFAFPAQATEHEQLPKNSTASEKEKSFGTVGSMRSMITIPLPSARSDAEDDLCPAGVAMTGHPTDHNSFVSEREQQHRLRSPVLVSALKHKGRDKCRRTISLPECTPTDRTKIAHPRIHSDSSLGVGIGGETDAPPRKAKTEFSWTSVDGGLSRSRRSLSSDCSERTPLACHSTGILSSSSSSSSSSAAAAARRRISFPADSVLTAVIQDGDNAELLRLLTGRRAPGVVQTPSVGVDVRQTNHVGLTALHHAILANNLDAAKLLLCHGADVNAQDVHGFSPLHTAAACGSLSLTSLLVLFGADVLALTHEQELPVDVAKDLGVTRLLLGEMTRRLQEDLWLTAFVHARATDAWMLARKLLAWVVLLVLHVLPKLWNTICRHEKRD
ncbi:arf-GAP with coiled-coil, ANK repeat and PH domain-containing protein 3-like [Pomacea canaliculata]|uniref:arf-GAP with coiled-coil, ANK repeat and PH domain-containing protein 3-like n=1 Tax=Pomacea canaliculata TaxID=400727 RepID=UPI000D72FBB5|nr:arf-GAP with coiled-coil, ANK repeat and PH domain-containing protein 3-like [Pomacea canaliculata]